MTAADNEFISFTVSNRYRIPQNLYFSTMLWTMYWRYQGVCYWMEARCCSWEWEALERSHLHTWLLIFQVPPPPLFLLLSKFTILPKLFNPCNVLCSGANIFQIKPTKTYTLQNFQEDFKQVISLAGFKGTKVRFVNSCLRICNDFDSFWSLFSWTRFHLFYPILISEKIRFLTVSISTWHVAMFLGCSPKQTSKSCSVIYAQLWRASNQVCPLENFSYLICTCTCSSWSIHDIHDMYLDCRSTWWLDKFELFFQPTVTQKSAHFIVS